MRDFSLDKPENYSPRDLATYLVEYEFSNPAARFKTHQELIAYYTHVLEKRESVIILQAKADENDYHWHHQKAIEQAAKTGISGYFLDRKDVLTAERAKLLS